MGPGALALLGRVLEALLDETHFCVFVMDAQRWRGGVQLLALAACKSVLNSNAARAGAMGGPVARGTRRLGRLGC